ncbi:PrgH/EprH family type III secretion apparatus protein [Herbaspirillum sp. RTI4]|uniref:PrgH/EprH family type III secretion apparatus protein n=1 Tax=Herbaspirillum sp. RTI4 TaxID=3048640 RepID=UPI002AB5336C|nr:PrgH/EprH family type III secretion apparatus protein [Herbaspirillum sp. RTI4]MDY7578356.1 PrgH/EprH family type III secretion apparatus protein [Herbaspirillum sp. RTI4]
MKKYDCGNEYVMRLLSGPLNGFEFSIGPGEYLFCAKPERFLDINNVADTLKLDERVIYLPTETDGVNFTIFVADKKKIKDQITALVHNKNNTKTIKFSFNEVIAIENIYFSVKLAGTAWEEAIENFISPQKIELTEEITNIKNKFNIASRGYRLFFISIICLISALIAIYALLFLYQDNEVTSLNKLFKDASISYEIETGRDNIHYIIANSEGDLEWARQAVIKTNVSRKVIITSRNFESDRISELLKNINVAFFVIHLNNIKEPEILISSNRNVITTEFINSLKKQILEITPYANKINIVLIEDSDVIKAAKDGLDKIGLDYHYRDSSSGVSLTNTGPIDDVMLIEVYQFIKDFYSKFGSQFININILLKDDFIKNNSFKYGSDSYIVMNKNHWDFSKIPKLIN